jgi:hypothetical protein
MDIGDEHLIRIVQGPQECRFFAVPSINPHPFEPHPAGTRLTHDIPCMFAFGRQLACVSRDAGLITSRRVLNPAVRQVKSHINRRMVLSVRQHAEHRHLAVVDLAQAARNWRATPTERSPCLAKLLSSMIKLLVGLPPSKRSAS